MFPGQGSQFVGMGKFLYENNDSIKSYFKNANDILGYDIVDIILNGPEEELKKTKNTQPAIFLINAVFLHVAREKGINPDFALGHSLGEYSALYCAGAITFEDGINLVSERGKLMEKAAENGIGAMAAIISLDREKLELICKELSTTHEIVEVANINSPEQIVISGHKTKVEEAVNKAKEAKAKRAILLDVSGPFHSSLMEPAKNKFKKIVNSIKFNDLYIPVITNVEARLIVSGSEAKELLIEQLTKSVEWVDSIKKMVNNSVNIFYEIGPGKVLSGLVKRINSEVKVFNFDDIINDKSVVL
jgi:[acyl-carrier-protein] S-malonyltransferase